MTVLVPNPLATRSIFLLQKVGQERPEEDRVCVYTSLHALKDKMLATHINCDTSKRKNGQTAYTTP